MEDMKTIVLVLDKPGNPAHETYARALLERALDFNKHKDMKLYRAIAKMIWVMIDAYPPIKTEKVTLKGSLYVAINTAFKTNNIPERLLRFMMIWNAREANPEERHVNFPVFEEYERVLQKALDMCIL